MEEMVLVYFTVDPESCGKKRRKDKWQYTLEEKFLTDIALRRVTVRLPAYSRGKRSWTGEQLAEYFSELPVAAEGTRVYYLYDGEAGRMLGRRSELLSAEWIFYLLAIDKTVPDALLILHERGMETERLVKKYAADTRYIGLLAKNPDAFTDLAEEISEEYGFFLDVAEDVRKLRLPETVQGNLLIIAGEEFCGITPARLPVGCTWLSVTEGKSAARKLHGRTDGIRFLSILTLRYLTE